MGQKTKTLMPKNEAEAASIIASAQAAQQRLELRGNGSKSKIGNAVSADLAISSANISGIVSYDPAELVMVAKAGTPLIDINKALAKNKQMHVFEPADLSKLLASRGKQTIGGVVATNMSGPRRFVAGAARDSLLGVRFINGQGQAIKNGGQVMKNVTGLDLVKLMAGSWGTLGFLTEVSVKVLPRPETEITLSIGCKDDADAAVLMAAAMATTADITGASYVPVEVAAILYGRPVKEGTVLLRLEGLKETISVRRDRVLAALENGSKYEELNSKESKAIWTAIKNVEPFANKTLKPVWKISVPPMAGNKVVAEILKQVDGQAFYDWQGGLVWLQLDDENHAAANVVRHAILVNGGGHATLIRASEHVKAVTPVFHPEKPPVAALSNRIKTAMDPDGLFNADRMGFDIASTN